MIGDQALQIGFLLFDNLTQLDLTGPWEVLSRLRNAECLHWMSRDWLVLFGAIPDNARVVIDRDRITGGGVTAGIDFALTLVALLADESGRNRYSCKLNMLRIRLLPGVRKMRHRR